MTDNNVFGLVREMVATWDRIPAEEKKSRRKDFFWSVMKANPQLKAAWNKGDLRMEKGLEELGMVLPSVPAKLVCDVALAVWFLHEGEEAPVWLGGMMVFKQIKNMVEWAEGLVERRKANPKATWAPKREFRQLTFGNLSYPEFKYPSWKPLSNKGYVEQVEKSLSGLIDPEWLDQFVRFMLDIDDAFTAFKGQYRKKAPSYALAEQILELADKYDPVLFPEGRRGLPFIADLTV